jgi:hypothetical protein
MNPKMTWRIIFSFLFVTSVVMMFVYSKKTLVEFDITTEGVGWGLDAQGNFSTTRPTKNVKREYRANYVAVGMVIGFAIIAGASVIAFAFTIRDKIVPAD